MKKDKDKIRKAIALHYDAEKAVAPRIVAKGSGEIAEKILEAARKHNVPVQENHELIEMMSLLKVG